MEAVIVALIGVVGSVLVVLVERGRKENVRDHAFVSDQLKQVQNTLENIDQDVAHIESKLDDHLRDHSIVGGFDLDDIWSGPNKFKTGESVSNRRKGNGSKKR